MKKTIEIYATNQVAQNMKIKYCYIYGKIKKGEIIPDFIYKSGKAKYYFFKKNNIKIKK